MTRPVALTIAAVVAALALVVVLVHHSHQPSATGAAPNDPRAHTLLVSTVAAAHDAFVERGSYRGVSPALLARAVRPVRVVGTTTPARAGEVSIWAVDATMFIAATPGTGGFCMFERAEPAKGRVGFASTPGSPCRAAGAPSQGWRGR